MNKITVLYNAIKQLKKENILKSNVNILVKENNKELYSYEGAIKRFKEMAKQKLTCDKSKEHCKQAFYHKDQHKKSFGLKKVLLIVKVLSLLDIERNDSSKKLNIIINKYNTPELSVIKKFISSHKTEGNKCLINNNSKRIYNLVQKYNEIMQLSITSTLSNDDIIEDVSINLTLLDEDKNSLVVTVYIS